MAQLEIYFIVGMKVVKPQLARLAGAVLPPGSQIIRVIDKSQ